MIIEPGSDKDIEAQREATAGPSLMNGSPVAGSSTSMSTSAAVAQQYDYPDDATENDTLLDVPPGSYPEPMDPAPLPEPTGPPPAFTPYEAEWFEVGNGDVVSHDEHLNTDGEALYRFLLTQASQRPPTYRIHCRGSHTETQHRLVTSHGGSGSSSPGTRTETYTESVTDFDFYIDVTPPCPSTDVTPPPPRAPVDSKTRTLQSPSGDPTPQDDFAPIHWSVADNEPVYRGKMVREVQVPASSRIALPEGDLPLNSSPDSHLSSTATHLQSCTRKERKNYTKWIKHRTSKGLPPWTIVPGVAHGQWSQAVLYTSSNPSSSATSGVSPLTTTRDILKSSKTVREWADSYCSSPKLLKEFVYTKLLYGWDISALHSAIQQTIALAPYQGKVEIEFVPINSKIYIRPSNRLSRIMSNVWLKFISIVLFIFPFIWLFKRFHAKGGGRWQVCGGAYALKRMVPLTGTPLVQSGSAMGSRSSVSGSSDLPSYEDVAGPSTLAPSSSHTLSPLTTSTSFPLSNLQSTNTPPSTPSSQPRIIQTPEGPCKLIGQREGEWFRYWEPVILRAVLTRYQSSIPLTSHSELYGRYAAPGSALEGYHDTPPGGAGSPVGSISLDGYSGGTRPSDGFGRSRALGGIFLP